MIREATIADLTALKDLARSVFYRDQYPELRIDYQKITSCFIEAIQTKNRHFLMVSQVDGSVEGALLGWVSPMLFYDRSQCTVLMWYVRSKGDGMRLMDEFMEWVKKRPMIRQVDWTSERGSDGRQAKILANRYGYRDDVNLMYWLKPAKREQDEVRK